MYCEQFPENNLWFFFILEEFKKTLREKKEELKALDDMFIELTPKDHCSSSNESVYGITGSFRKLEVD